MRTITYRIEPDELSGDPREAFDHFSTLACWHRRANLGDRQPTEAETDALSRGMLRDRNGRVLDETGGFYVLARYLRRYEGAVYVAPLGLYEHSGMTMWLGGGTSPFDAQGWDSGTVGFVYVTNADLDRCGRDPVLSPEEQAKRIAEQEVEEYDQYLRGDVWGYIVEDERGEHLDSCWGFYGREWAEQEAKEAAKTFQDEADEIEEDLALDAS